MIAPVPRVSVIIPSYQSAKTLPTAIVSVQAQHVDALEILIIDDCSTDNTAEVVRALAEHDPRIRYFLQAVNGGPASARNRGLQEAKGQLVAFLDADDQWYPDNLGMQITLLDANPQLTMIYTDGSYLTPEAGEERKFSEINQTIRQTLTWKNLDDQAKLYQLEGQVARALYTKCFIQMNAVLVRREALDAIGGFDPRRFGTEDIDLWVRLAQKFTFGYWDRVTFTYQHAASSLSRPGERWYLELVDYHFTCKTEPTYATLRDLAVKNLAKVSGYLIAYYGRQQQLPKALNALLRSIKETGFRPKLTFYFLRALFGTMLYYLKRLSQRFSRTRVES